MHEFLANFQGMSLFKITNFKNLKTAKMFHKEIINNLRTAKKVFIITLYFGNKQKTREIMEEIRIRKQKNLETMVIIDYNRCKQNEQIFVLLKEYQIEDVVCYANRKSYFLLPNCIKELFFVLHVKMYLFDSLVILSGANLEDKYFTNRLDRYFSINDSELAEYLMKNVFNYFYKSSYVESNKKN
ncbi:Phosphatidylglycerolphosphate synthase [Trachipleistophora hominis]|uniref:CDP-diacylglycerol--glycerol-3-phosphate 3-phosphatidyltransferase n=1 Tax=Trachipleistophora hominis TaxID=72359 RepID=L7JW06_TRAHO|nr:Phosphatidylglycerolphosphate synthase [Trachipleistophora hominis]